MLKSQQGDTISGNISRQELARLVVTALSTPEAAGALLPKSAHSQAASGTATAFMLYLGESVGLVPVILANAVQQCEKSLSSCAYDVADAFCMNVTADL